MGPSPTCHPPEGQECETSVEHGLPLWAEPAVGYCSRRPRPSPMWGSRFVGARAVGPWVREQKPLGKTPLRGNPNPEMTYLPTLHALGATIGTPPPSDVANPPKPPKRARGGRGNCGRGGGGGAKWQRTDTASTRESPSQDTVLSNPVPAPYSGPPPTTTPVIPLTVAPLQNASMVPPLAPLTCLLTISWGKAVQLYSNGRCSTLLVYDYTQMV